MRSKQSRYVGVYNAQLLHTIVSGLLFGVQTCLVTFQLSFPAIQIFESRKIGVLVTGLEEGRQIVK